METLAEIALRVDETPRNAWLWLKLVMYNHPTIEECEARAPEELKAAQEWARYVWRRAWWERPVPYSFEKPQWIADWEAAQKEAAK